MDFLIYLSEKLNNLTQGNILLGGVIGAWALGVITIITKSVPSKVWKLFLKHNTTTLSITNNNQAYYSFIRILEKEKVSDKIRIVKLYNGRWGNSKNIIKGIGSGSHIIFFKKCPLFINITSHLDKTMGNEEKLQIDIIKLGRSHKLFNDLIEELSNDDGVEEKNKNELRVFGYNNGWENKTNISKRYFNSIILEKNKETQILNTIESFKKKESWYLERGVPYTLGILLYGPPGTGKSSIIKAIASYLDYNICILKADSLYHLSDAVSYLNRKDLFVIEDFDSNTSVHKRTDNSTTVSSGAEFLENIKAIGLSEILNALDGLISCHGRIMILTTNCIDKIDPALLRPGRIDIKIEIGYVNNETFNMFLEKFFNYKEKAEFDEKNKLTVAQLQGMYLEGKTLNQFIEKYCKEKNNEN